MDLDNISVSTAWKNSFEGAHIGLLLVEDVDNARRETPLDAQKRTLEADIRNRYAGFERADLVALPILAAYKKYYRQFGNTYHVQLQLESVLKKGKSLPNVSPLVDAAFSAELDTLILTASHDVDQLAEPVQFSVTDGSELLTQMNGKDRQLKANDMLMVDANGAQCSILAGQHRDSAISPQTKKALYVAYVPAGISAEITQQHLDTIVRNVRLFAPDAAFASRIIAA